MPPVQRDASPIEATIRQIVRDELARALGSTSDDYSSINLPRGVSRRSFRERCASGRVDGARREGRIWTCSRSAWHASRSTTTTTTTAEPRTDASSIADAALAAVSRRTRAA